MKNSQAKNKAVANRRRSTDAQVAEFDRKDFGADVRRAKAAVVVRRGATRPTSLSLETDLIEKLREKGGKRGLGYQTMLKLIVREHLDEY
jgi:uncharacterized protein (DUF4415 family)